MTRKSLALYYYTQAAGPIKVQSTEYRPRPADRGLKGMLIYLDKMVLRFYDVLRRRLGLSDAVFSKLVRFFNRRGGKEKP